MKTCINCLFRDQEDGCCWCSSGAHYSEEVDETTKACDEYESDEI